MTHPETAKASGWESNCWQYKCSDGFHPSFWKTIVQSEEWKQWQKEQGRRLHEHNEKESERYTGCFDIDESTECGWLSPEHWREFCLWLRKTQFAILPTPNEIGRAHV